MSRTEAELHRWAELSRDPAVEQAEPANVLPLHTPDRAPAPRGEPASEVSVNSVQAGQVCRAWEPPEPLGRTVDVPAFPTDALPSPLADFVAAEAAATQTPPDLAGALVLATVSACAGGRIRVQASPGWVEPTNLYAAAVLGSGERKSAVFADTVAPLEAAERSLLADARPVICDAATRRRIAERRAQLAADHASKAGPADREALEIEACQAAAELDALIVPAEPRLLADDATPEALTSLLAEQGGRIAVMSPEGGCFDIMAGRYTQGGAANFDVWLKAHAGDAIRVDRKGRPAEFVPRPALTMGLAVQPVVLRQIVGKEGFRGRGLLARFLYAVPRSTVGRRAIDPPSVPEDVRDAYHHTVTTLARSLADAAEPLPVLTLDGPARAVLQGFAAELEARMGDDGDLGHIRDWAGKLTGAVVRLAGLLHVAEQLTSGWASPITEPTVTAAIRLGRYFAAHAVAAFDLMNADPLVRGARVTLRWIRERPEPLAAFSQRDAHRALRAHFEKVEDIKPALALLEACRLIRRQPSTTHKGRGRPSLTYDVNPLPPQE